MDSDSGEEEDFLRDQEGEGELREGAEQDHVPVDGAPSCKVFISCSLIHLDSK